MNSSNGTWTIAAIDGSQYSASVCDYAFWVSKTLGSPFKALHSIEHGKLASKADYTGAIGLGAKEILLNQLSELEQEKSKLEIQKGRQMLDTVVQRAKDAGLDDAEPLQRHGSITEALIDLEDKAKIVVVGVRGEAHETDEGHLGSQLETLIRSIHRPILVVNGEFKEPKNVLLAYDGRPCSVQALDMLISSPLFESVFIHVVNVAYDLLKGEKVIQQAIDKLEASGRQFSTQIHGGEAAKILCKYQQEHDIDITIMGAFSHSRIKEIVFGSFTMKMLLNTHKPLLLLR